MVQRQEQEKKRKDLELEKTSRQQELQRWQAECEVQQQAKDALAQRRGKLNQRDKALQDAGNNTKNAI